MRTSLTLLFLIPIVVSTLASSSQCPPCGDLKVPYPLSTNPSCGSPNYTLYCVNNTLKFLSQGGPYYRVLSIDSVTNRLVISVPKISVDSCMSSDLVQGGLVLDETLPFNISNRNEVMLFNCSDDILLSPLNCSSNSPCHKFENGNIGSSCNNTLCCSYLKDSAMTSHRIRVRIGGCTAYTSVLGTNFEHESPENWKFGIELQWA